MSQISTRSRTTSVPPLSYLVEYGYYAVIFYSMLGVGLGISFPLIGAGALAGLAMICAMHYGLRGRGLYGPIALALLCVISILMLQVFVHDESLMHSRIRSYIMWALSLVVTQALFLRQGFFHRFAIYAFLLGCATLPWLKVYGSTEELTRIGVSHDVGLGNPNVFGMWFGFCSVYFIVRGLEADNYLVRLVSWSAGLLSVFLVAITVSRGPVLGVAIATVFACQKILRRSFLPILSFIFLVWIIFMSGLFDELIGYYTERGAKDSGRGTLWRMGFDIFMGSWWGGVGVSNSMITGSGHGDEVAPHNVLLFLGMQSGIIPVLFFIGYLGSAGLKAFRARAQRTPDAPFMLPLFSFAFLEMMILDQTFMSPWTMVVFSAALASDRAPCIRQKTRGVVTGSMPMKNKATS